MRYRNIITSLSLCVWLTMANAAAAAPYTVTWSGNGHTYRISDGFRGTWEEAWSHLDERRYPATITSMEEQSFIAEAFSGYHGEFWLGGYQSGETDPSGEADQNWNWVTGEPWDYNHWAAGEPNEYRGYLENHLGIWNDGGSRWNWSWNDEHGSANIAGIIVESEATTVPEPPAAGLYALALMSLMLLHRRKH